MEKGTLLTIYEIKKYKINSVSNENETEIYQSRLHF
jgi:hypothetical protein